MSNIVFILGAGANILFGDKGYRGLVIKNEANTGRFEGNRLIAGSGAMVADLIELSLNKGLSGLEHFTGIPSTIGGAIWQNLHFLSPDRTKTLFIADIIDSVEIMDEQGKVFSVDKDFFKFSYDYSILHDRSLLVTEATFQLQPQEKSIIQNQIVENMKWRNEKQPQLFEYASCGSVFKKIKDIGAGRLIDLAGLKGYTIGGAQISHKHANYILNTGIATAKDVISLIGVVQNKVKIETGHTLEPEITFIGEF